MRRLLPTLPILLLAAAVQMPGFARAEPQKVLRAESIKVVDERIRPAEVYQDTPVETEILTAEEVRQLPAVNLIEALDAIPGILIQGQVQGQRGAVKIDGLPPEFTELLVNGQRYAGETDEAIDLGDLLFADVERIEILRGPQALRYSPRAGGGVINVITRPPPTNGGTFNTLVGVGDHERRSLEGSVAYGNETLGGSLIIDHNSEGGFDNPFPGSNDIRDGLASPFGEGSTYRTTDLYATLISKPSHAVELRGRFGYRLRDDAFAVNNGPVSSRREDQRLLGNLELDFDLSESTRLYSKLTVTHTTTDTSAGREFELKDDYERVQLGVEQFLEIGRTSHILSLGGDLVSTGIELNEGPVPATIVNPALTPQTVQHRSLQGGIFLVTESEMTDWLSVEAGLRLEMKNDFTPEWLPQGAVLITPVRWGDHRSVKLRFSAGRSTAYPSLRDRYQPPAAQNGGAYFLAGSSALKQERVWALRSSVEVNPAKWISGTVSGFYNETKDRIRSQFQGTQIQVDTTILPADPALCPTFPDRCADQILPVLASVFEKNNIDSLRTWGIQTRLELRPYSWMTLELGYTWQRTRLEDSNLATAELPNTPRHIVTGKLVLTAPRFDTQLTVRGSWRDRAFIENSGTGLVSFVTSARSRDSYDLDLRLRQPLERLFGVDVDLFLDVSNLSDNRVVDSNQVRGRSFFGGLKARFH